MAVTKLPRGSVWSTGSRTGTGVREGNGCLGGEEGQMAQRLRKGKEERCREKRREGTQRRWMGEEQSRCCGVLGHGDVLLGTSGPFHHVKRFLSVNLCTAFLSKQNKNRQRRGQYWLQYSYHTWISRLTYPSALHALNSPASGSCCPPAHAVPRHLTF